MDDSKRKSIIPVIAQNTGSLILVAGAIYILKELAVLYGIGLGAAVQAIGTNTQAVPLVASAASQLTALHQVILESYVLFLIALGLSAASFILFMKRYEKNNTAITTYSLLHSAFVVVYIVILYLIFSSFYANLATPYLYVIYAGVALCVICDLYFQYTIRQPTHIQKSPGGKHSFNMDPTKPFSNVIVLQEQLFPNMNGHLRIIDKNFNSSALANFHRLSEHSITNFTKISILTSKYMLDSSFGNDVTDFRNELTEAGVGLDVKLMDDKDVVEQHERLILDDKIAYKIPPFNIINKRSEHITRINYDEASRRFNQLHARAIKLENYAVKKGREEPQEDKK
jgi:hypothetical protein